MIKLKILSDGKADLGTARLPNIVAGFPQHYALTIWQPWCSAIVQGSKRIENRGWRPPEWIIGKRIWLHAGKRFDIPGSLTCAKLGFDRAKVDLPLGAIIGSARVGGYQTDAMPKAKMFSREGWLYEGADLRRDQWWVGPVGWVLEDVQPIKPQAALGMQKLWIWPPSQPPEQVDPVLDEAVNAALEEGFDP